MKVTNCRLDGAKEIETPPVITKNSKTESPTLEPTVEPDDLKQSHHTLEPDDSKLESPTVTTDDTTETLTEEPHIGLGYSKIRVTNHSRAWYH